MAGFSETIKIQQTTHLPTDTSMMLYPIKLSLKLSDIIAMNPTPKNLNVFELSQQGPGRMAGKDVKFSLNMEYIRPKDHLLDPATLTCVQKPQPLLKAQSVSCGPGTHLVGTQCMPNVQGPLLTAAKAQSSASICEHGYTLKEFVCSENSSAPS